MTQLKLYLFGSPRVLLDETPVTIPRRKVLATLIYIALTRKPVRRDTLAGLFWPTAERKTSRTSLRRELYALNQAIGPEWLQVTRDDITLNPDGNVWIDIDEFREFQATAPDAENRLHLLQQAASLYQSDFLTGFTLSDCPAFDDWQFFESEGLRSEYAVVLSQLVTLTKGRKEYSEAIDYARRWLTLDNLEESVHRTLMELHALADQQSAAIRQYDECVRILDEELGVSPEEETAELFKAIQERRISSPDISSTPTPIRQPQTESHKSPPVNLPSLSTSFVGRDEELAAIVDLLTVEPDCRMLTLVGPGGIGKTRLAIAVADQISKSQKSAGANLDDALHDHFVDGIYYAPLVTIHKDESILPSLAEALNFSFQNTADPQSELIHFLESKSALLLLDNFEHVLEQSGLLLDILKQAPKITVLITSRVSINLQEEWLYAVNGFEAPAATESTEVVANNNAVQLFIQRARRADSSLTFTDDVLWQIGRICRLVDGLPLGIELAASWVRVLGIDEIANEIEANLDFLATTKHTVLERHSNMRAVLDQTWDLLSSSEREIFQRLSIFQYGFSRQAANRVADASITILAALVRKSIISYGVDGRYSIHALLRQFAETKLAKREALIDELSEKHSRYFGNFLQALMNDRADGDSAILLTQIGQDLNNIRTGWRWAIDQLETTPTWARLADRYVDGLFHFYDTRSRFREGVAEFRIGYDCVRVAGVRVEDYQDPDALSDADTELILLRGRTSARLGWFTFQIGQPEEAKALLLASLDCHRFLETQVEISFSLNYLGAVYRHLGAYAEATDALEESQQLCRDTRDQFGLTVALNILGQIAYEQGLYAEAQRYLEESLQVKETIGDKRGTTFSLLYLGLVATAQEDFAKAMRLFRESKLISESYGDRRGIAIALGNLADAEKGIGNWVEAQNLYEESLTIYTGIDNVIGVVTANIQLGELALLQNNSNATAAYYTQAIEAADSLRLTDQALDALVAKPRAWLLEKDEIS